MPIYDPKTGARIFDVRTDFAKPTRVPSPDERFEALIGQLRTSDASSAEFLQDFVRQLREAEADQRHNAAVFYSELLQLRQSARVADESR